VNDDRRQSSSDEAFLPLLTRSRGAIVNAVSISAFAAKAFERQNAALLEAEPVTS
jgi:hypothetical protein